MTLQTSFMTMTKHYLCHYVDGQWAAATSADNFTVFDSSSEERFASVPAGTLAETHQAVMAARAAASGWAAMSVMTRADFLDKIAAGLQTRADEIAIAISREVGMPLKLARAIQVGAPIWHWKNFANVARAFPWEEQVAHSLVVREPIGVVACITPWNFPLSQVTLKVAPALVAGCTVVVKPSEVAPVSAMILAEVVHEAGLPPGVFNLINGAGPSVGEELARHPEVDMVSFTGSTRAGKRVAELASQSIKKVTLELGGKSSSIILPDADFRAAVKGTISSCMLNSGQTCSAHTRMLVPEGRYHEVKQLAQEVMENYNIGPSLELTTKLGPLASAFQRDRVTAMVAQAIAGGAEVVACGPANSGQAKGYFVRPVILRVEPDSPLAQEEIFGPVLVVITYATEADAVKIANNTIYGLGGGVWSADESHALVVARQIRTGQVDINGAAFNGNAPFGGQKQSGNGRENGRYGLEEFLEFKSLQCALP